MKTFIGHDNFEVNSYFFPAPEGNILFDAPAGADKHFAKEKIDLLVITHGHPDHTTEAAAIQRRHGCKIAVHADTVPMLTDADYFSRWSLPFSVDPVEKCDILLTEGTHVLCGEKLQIFDTPGHCPGSICTLLTSHGALVTGDVLFAGSIGRTDLPGGDTDTLIRNIRTKLLTLPPLTRVLPGHGPASTIAQEAATNPFLV